MVYLHMDASGFSIKSAKTVKAPYASFEDALSQATHNLATGVQRPVRIEDDQGNVLKEFKQ